MLLCRRVSASIRRSVTHASSWRLGDEFSPQRWTSLVIARHNRKPSGEYASFLRTSSPRSLSQAHLVNPPRRTSASMLREVGGAPPINARRLTRGWILPSLYLALSSDGERPA